VTAGVAIDIRQWIVPFSCARSFRFHGNWEGLVRGEAIASDFLTGMGEMASENCKIRSWSLGIKSERQKANIESQPRKIEGFQRKSSS
jgi:hypothetical protein